jgi:2-polyprenyl-3-methyl-5-hydroxy-6-metoxy-1,4-benzoquinol methylase
MKTNEKIIEKLKSQDPWYTSDQIQSSLHKSQKRIVEGRQRFFSQVISDHIKYKNYPVILDAGCGDGVNLNLLNNFKGATIYGMDYNPLRITRAKKSLQDISILQGDLLALPFKEQLFDVILLNQVLEHIPEDGAVIREIYKSLKQDGLLILCVPNEGCFLGQLRNNVIQRSISRTTDHIHFYTEQHMTSLLNSNNWTIKEIRREGFFIPYTLLYNFLTMFDLTFSSLNYLMQKFPTQCAGLYFVCTKEVKE